MPVFDLTPVLIVLAVGGVISALLRLIGRL